MPMIFVSIVGPTQVAANTSHDGAVTAAVEMLAQEVANNVHNAAENGDARKSVAIRTVYLEVGK